MPTPLMSPVRASVGWSIAVSVLMIVAGLIAIGLPHLTGIAVGRADRLGAAGPRRGASRVRLAHADQARRDLALLSAVVYLAPGFYLLVRPVAGLALLTLALAIYLFVEGVLEFILSFQLRPWPGAGWLLVDGIVTFILAAMIWSTWP